MLMLAHEKSTWLRPPWRLTVRSSSTSVKRPFWMSDAHRVSFRQGSQLDPCLAVLVRTINDASTWLSTTSFRIVKPASSRPSAKRRA